MPKREISLFELKVEIISSQSVVFSNNFLLLHAWEGNSSENILNNEVFQLSSDFSLNGTYNEFVQMCVIGEV